MLHLRRLSLVDQAMERTFNKFIFFKHFFSSTHFFDKIILYMIHKFSYFSDTFFKKITYKIYNRAERADPILTDPLQGSHMSGVDFFFIAPGSTWGQPMWRICNSPVNISLYTRIYSKIYIKHFHQDKMGIM